MNMLEMYNLCITLHSYTSAVTSCFFMLFVSDIAIFVLKRDVKLQLTNSLRYKRSLHVLM